MTFMDDLRKQAEAKVAAFEAAHKFSPLSPDEVQDLLHEFRVHQVQLDMLNEKLRKSRLEKDGAQSRFFEMYDLVPVGYLTVDEQGVVLGANLACAAALGVPKEFLAEKKFASFVYPEDADLWFLLYKKLFETKEPQSCLLRLLRVDTTFFPVRLKASFALDFHDMPVCNVVILDGVNEKAGA